SGSGIGLFNWLDAPIWLSVPLSILLLDCAIYWQHVLTHRVPMLWRLHRVHHSDHDVDVTTALRFHPFEIAFSMGLKIGLVVALGAPAAAVVLFEVILNGMAMFNHANARLPRWLERPLRWLVVTPEMHRIHHSQDEAETNSNYGFNLSLWDRIFGTYQRQSAHGDGFALGLSDYERAPTDNLLWTLTLPLETPSAARDSDDGPTAADKHA
ncbi:MAG: sterol desaturase family protein, partial [Pseudomonadota bacterium]